MKILNDAGAVCVLLGVGATAAVAHPVEYEEHTFASIDCAKDFGPAVDTICKSRHLRYLDQEIAERYTRAYASAGRNGKARLLAEQRKFLVIRDGCGTDAGCLSDILHHRTDTISAR